MDATKLKHKKPVKNEPKLNPEKLREVKVREIQQAVELYHEGYIYVF